MRKWHRGVGTNEATNPTRSLFVYPGYLKVVVDAAMTVLTNELTRCTLGFRIRSRSTAMRFNTVLSSTTTQSALRVSLAMPRCHERGPITSWVDEQAQLTA